MKMSVVSTTLATAALAFALAACDQQQADSGDDGSAVPLQQQGAMPADPAATSGVSSESQPAAIDSMPQTETPAQPSDTQ